MDYPNLITIIASTLVFIRAYRVYSISREKSIKYFSLAFLMYTIGFAARFLQKIDYLGFLRQDYLWTIMVMLLSVAGFYLLYSFLYKELETPQLALWIIAAGVAVIDTYYITSVFVVVQLIVFGYAAVITYPLYSQSGLAFHRMYFLAMLAGTIAYAISILSFVIPGFEYGLVIDYLIASLFAIILVGVLNSGKKKRTTGSD